MSLSKEQIEEFKAKNSTIEFRAVTIDDTTVALIRRPDRANWRAYRSMQDKQGSLARLDSYEFITRHATLLPSSEALEKLMADQPGIVETLASEIAELAGSTAKAKSEKI